ncbi:hypothetical protein BO70DRAFT_396633 [Aspergillus heteromorphus CBS 117.55]|uniref:Uncharacterized protein n=1 Tax=Aspergillus heteromorphus CBS 117.55 TaxID=1448321 RepID=A0A317WCH3_9EURO|nr:uncharacterized protein BO70DRAFT_396633 [Aspergillus heteromorphus CBS 117.55]PWY81850.1 hypothetical protein BO70DRAFT_396633 [Aspergillus heteromorphus CBS 117.55]
MGRKRNAGRFSSSNGQFTRALAMSFLTRHDFLVRSGRSGPWERRNGAAEGQGLGPWHPGLALLGHRDSIRAGAVAAEEDPASFALMQADNPVDRAVSGRGQQQPPITTPTAAPECQSGTVFFPSSGARASDWAEGQWYDVIDSSDPLSSTFIHFHPVSAQFRSRDFGCLAWVPLIGRRATIHATAIGPKTMWGHKTGGGSQLGGNPAPTGSDDTVPT